jgi:protein SCO1/2
LRALSMLPGREFDIVTVSFNPSETVKQAAEKKRAYLAQLGRKGAEQGWHFLTGDTDSIRALTRAVGFSYRWDTASKQYAHATGLMVLTPAGKLSRYFYGVEYAAGDLRLALIEAADNKIGSAVDQVLLYCYRYDPTTGKYALVIMNVIRVAGVATVLALLGAVFVFLRRDRRTAPGLGAPLTDHAG